jgi:hypothetical protein
MLKHAYTSSIGQKCGLAEVQLEACAHIPPMGSENNAMVKQALSNDRTDAKIIMHRGVPCQHSLSYSHSVWLSSSSLQRLLPSK